MKNMSIKKIIILLLTIINVVACSPTYNPEPNAPEMTTASSEAPYEMDFIQINNDIIDYYSQESLLKYFPFITDLSVDGKNDPAEIDLNLSVKENVSDEAIAILLSDLAKNIGDEAAIQDFRLKDSSETGFGTVYDHYAFHYKVTVNDEVKAEDTVEAGTEFPLDPSYDLTYLKEYLAKNEDIS